MKTLLDLSVGLDRAQSQHQYFLKPNMQFSSVNQPIDDSHIMHYYGIGYKISAINVSIMMF